MSFLKMRGNTEARRDMILNGNTFRSITVLAIPSLLLATVQSLIPLIDGIFINNVIGGVSAGAINFCGPVINFINAIGMGLGVASTAIIGQMNGRGDYPLARRVAVQVIVISIIFSTVAIPMVIGAAFPVTAGLTEDIRSDSFTYLVVSSFFLPFSFLSSQFNAFKNASGKPESPLVMALVLLPLKVTFDFLFINLMQLRVLGAALASVSAFLVQGIVILWMLFVRPGEDRLTLKGFRFDKSLLKEVLRIGAPSMLQGAVLQIGFLLMNFETEKFGAVALTGMSISSNINGFAFSIPSSVAAAVTTMVSMNMGNGNAAKAKKSCYDALLISIAVSLLLCLLIIPIRTHITSIFTRQQDIADIASWAMLIMTVSSFGFSTCMVLLSAFTGLGDTLIPFVVNVLRVWGIRYIFILATEHFFGLNSIIVGNLISNYLAAGISFILFLRLKWVSSLRNI